MFSFFKRKERVLIPEWAPFEFSKEYTEFKNAVTSYFKDYEVQLDFDRGQVHIRDVELFGINRIYLTNLSRYCLSRGTGTDFATTIEEFMGTMQKAKDHNPQSQSFETVKSELGLRIITNRVFKQMDEISYIGSAFFEDLFYYLVFDLPDSAMNVKHADVAAWNISHTDLIEIGKNNINRRRAFR